MGVTAVAAAIWAAVTLKKEGVRPARYGYFAHICLSAPLQYGDSEAAVYALDLVTIVVPPALPLVLTVGTPSRRLGHLLHPLAYALRNAGFRHRLRAAPPAARPDLLHQPSAHQLRRKGGRLLLRQDRYAIYLLGSAPRSDAIDGAITRSWIDRSHGVSLMDRTGTLTYDHLSVEGVQAVSVAG